MQELLKTVTQYTLKQASPHLKKEKIEETTKTLTLSFRLTVLKNLFEEFSNKLVEFIQPLRDMPYGREFYIADPDSYIIAFLEEK